MNDELNEKMKLKMIHDPLTHDLVHTFAHIKEMATRLCENETKDFQINHSAAELLYVIGHTHMNQKEIAKRFCITEATLSVRIKRLEKQGYLIRKPDEKDRRRYHLILTDQAKKELDGSVEKNNQIHDLILKGVTEEDFKNILHVLKIMEKNLEEKEGE